jgi:hypothetical protein
MMTALNTIVTLVKARKITIWAFIRALRID